jgi:NTE family protein
MTTDINVALAGEPDVQTSPRITGTALCLSGGGFRATLYCLGSLWRLNEFGALKNLKLITSVSGGSIASAYLAFRWKDLRWNGDRAQNFEAVVAKPLQDFCARKIAIPAAVGGLLNPFKSIGQEMTEAYQSLFGNATLEDLPRDPAPEFLLYATSLQTGRSVRMTRAYLADYRVGLLPNPKIPIAQAVAASSAFPPVLSPQEIEMDPADWQSTKYSMFTTPEWRAKLVLTDGGVYDNMGLEAAWHRFETVLVCDAGAPFKADPRPAEDWVRQPVRIMDIQTDQTRALRKRWLLSDFRQGLRSGTYWGIRTSIGEYTAPGMTPIVMDSDLTRSLASIRTHLDPFSPQEQGHLINWGYALTDAAVRRWLPNLGNTPGVQPIETHQL